MTLAAQVELKQTDDCTGEPRTQSASGFEVTFKMAFGPCRGTSHPYRSINPSERCATLVMASLYQVRTRPVFLYRALIAEHRSDPNPSNRPNNRLGENPSGPPPAPRRNCLVQRATPLDFPASLRSKSISRPSTSSENSHSFP